MVSCSRTVLVRSWVGKERKGTGKPWNNIVLQFLEYCVFLLKTVRWARICTISLLKVISLKASIQSWIAIFTFCNPFKSHQIFFYATIQDASKLIFSFASLNSCISVRAPLMWINIRLLTHCCMTYILLVWRKRSVKQCLTSSAVYQWVETSLISLEDTLLASVIPKQYFVHFP